VIGDQNRTTMRLWHAREAADKAVLQKK